MTNTFIQSTMSFDALLDGGWESSIQNFLTWTIQAAGIEETSETFAKLVANVRTMADLNSWIDCFNGDLDAVEATTEHYMQIA